MRSARTLGAMRDLAEWALVFGLSLVLYTGIGWLRVWSMEQPPTSTLTERHARTGRRLLPLFLVAGIALMVVGGIGFFVQHL
jgi:hypothetical protein